MFGDLLGLFLSSYVDDEARAQAARSIGVPLADLMKLLSSL